MLEAYPDLKGIYRQRKHLGEYTWRPPFFLIVGSIKSGWSGWFVPEFSGNVALFATNKAVLARFIILVIFATFVRLSMAIMSTHTIQIHWGTICRFIPFTICATSTKQVLNLQNSLSKYTNFFKGLWVLIKNLTANIWLNPWINQSNISLLVILCTFC